MQFTLTEDLERFGRMAFVRAADCTEVIKGFHKLRAGLKPNAQSPSSFVNRRRQKHYGRQEYTAGDRKPEVGGLRSWDQSPKPEVQSPSSFVESTTEDGKPEIGGLRSEVEGHPDYGLLTKIYAWVFVPLSVWPVDVRGLCAHLLDCIASGERLDEGARLLCSMLPDAPPATVCDPLAEYEHAVKAGSYESLINAQFKFDSMEAELAGNEEFKADWKRIKAQFTVEAYRNAKGIIRRRMVQERNFRPRDWRFSWKTEAERFQNVFDAFCHRWNLYGIEGDKPLLLKLTVNVTPYGTIIVVPKYWSFDPKRDLKWGAVTKLHKMREVKRQGPKLSPGRSARREEAGRARGLWQEATEGGLKGERRAQWVMGRLGWDPRTDETKLKRLLRSLRSKV